MVFFAAESVALAGSNVQQHTEQATTPESVPKAFAGNKARRFGSVIGRMRAVPLRR